MRPTKNKFDCNELLENIELEFVDLSLTLGILYRRYNHRLMKVMMQSILEETLNSRTDKRFYFQEDLTLKTVKLYLENEYNLNEEDLKDIEELFVYPLLDEARVKLSKLFDSYDPRFSKWEVVIGDDFGSVEINYLGDYRIDDWHKQNSVDRTALITAKKHQVRRSLIERIIDEELDFVDERCLNDIPVILDKVLVYYVSGETDEHFQELVRYIKSVINEGAKRTFKKPSKVTAAILRRIEAIPAFMAFREDTRFCDGIFSSLSTTTVFLEIILPNTDTVDKELRDTLLSEIKERGFIDQDIDGKVESIYA